MPTVYIETSIIGYTTARSGDAVIFLARQQLTQEWWADQSGKYDLVTSQLVIDEASAGDPTAAQERLSWLDDLPLLDVQHPDVQTLADKLIAAHHSPREGGSGRAACSRFNGIRSRLFVDVELQAYR